MRIIALTKWADDFHPARVKPIVNGEEAVLDPGWTRSSDVDGQIRPWKKDMPINTTRMRYRMEFVA
jgi:hypothetical protein